MHLRRIALSLLILLLAMPGLASADWEAGVAAFKAKNYKEAATQFQQVIEQQPDEFQGYMMLGRALLSDGQAAKAVPNLQKALELKSGDPGIQLLLAQALYQTRKYREVVQVLDGLDPSKLAEAMQANYYQMRGGSYASINQTDRAVSDLGKWAQLKPSDAKAQYEYGKAAYSAGKTREAILAFEKAIKIDGDDTEMRKSYVEALKRSGRLANSSEKEAIYGKAEAAAQALVRSQPTYDNLLLLGEVQLGAKSYDAAIDSLQKASAKKTTDWLPYYYLGQAYAAKNQYSSAEPPLQSALEKVSTQDDKKTVWNQIAYVYEKQRKFDEAISAYQQAGNRAGETRVAENKAIARENKEVEEHNRQVEQLEAEAKALEEELKALPGGSAPPPQ